MTPSRLFVQLVSVALWVSSPQVFAQDAASPRDPAAASRDVPLVPRALLVFVDGLIPDAIALTDTPAIDRLMDHAAWSLRCRAEDTTISGSGWSTFLTGVRRDKHNVPDNRFAAPDYVHYPHVFTRLREARPEALTVSCQSWLPIEEGLVQPSRPDVTLFHDYDRFDARSGREPGSSVDRLGALALAEVLRTTDVDLAVMMFGELDGVGHSEGNAHYDAGDALYQAKLGQIDGQLGLLLDAIDGRAARAREDWLVVLCADHAGSKGLGHGRNIPEHRQIPFVASAASIVAGEIWPPPQAADVAVTALAHLGVAIDPAWDLDGVPQGRVASVRPVPALGVELVQNGGAEWDRGFGERDVVPDESVSAWDDPGAMNVLRWGSPGMPSGDAPGPPDRGRNLFAGAGGARMSQTIDFAPLRDGGGHAGFGARLAASVGAASGASGRMRVVLHALDGAGGVLAEVEVGPAAEEAGLSVREAGLVVPPGTAMLRIELIADTPADGPPVLADDVSLVVWKRTSR